MRRHFMLIIVLLILISFWIYLTFVALTFEELMENQKATVSEICRQFKNTPKRDKKYIIFLIQNYFHICTFFSK